MKKNKKLKRRELLSLGLVAGAGAIVGAGIKKSIENNVEEKSVKMLTPDGKLVEVGVRHLPKGMRKKPISNEQLKDWMEDKTG